MHAREHADSPEELQAERRKFIRHAIDEEATLHHAGGGERIPGRLVDLSLGGCRMRAESSFHLAPQTRVEVSFKVRGVVFRFSGVVLWVEDQQLIGIRFQEIPLRRRLEFADLLCEVLAAQRNKDKKVAVPAVRAPEALPGRVTPLPIRSHAVPRPVLTPDKPLVPAAASHQPHPAQPGSAPSGLTRQAPAQDPEAAPPQAGRERRTQVRHEVDTTATILLVNVAARLKGRILDLSLGGCRIRTDERFPVGIYTRVETEFHLEGLPFRLGGVVQSIQGKNFVGIRFLDMSDRKREQLQQLIEEIEDLRARGLYKGAEDAPEHPEADAAT